MHILVQCGPGRAWHRAAGEIKACLLACTLHALMIFLRVGSDIAAHGGGHEHNILSGLRGQSRRFMPIHIVTDRSPSRGAFVNKLV